MTPFASRLRVFRWDRNVRQKDLAIQLGVDPAYLSGVETGRRPAPQPELIRKIVFALGLNPQEQHALEIAAKCSSMQIRIPVSASVTEFEILHWIVDRIGTLDPEQLQSIRSALKMENI